MNWKDQAACSTYQGPLDKLPTSMCAVCPVQAPCDELYLTLQAELDDHFSKPTRLDLGGVWGGHPRSVVMPTVVEGIVACDDSCSASVWARGACREHYNQQYWKQRVAKT